MIEIGASEAPAVLGVSPYDTPWSLWARKVGLLPDERESDEVMRWGTRLEKDVLWGFYEEAGVVTPGYKDGMTPSTRYHPERKWQRATPDDFTGEALIEIKCVVGNPPPVPRVEWIVQCLHQRLVFEEASSQHIVAFGALRMLWWEIPYHQKALDRVLREEERFLELVEKQIPPPVRAEDASALARAWPITKPEVLKLGAEALKWDAQLIVSKAKALEWTQRENEAKANLMALMGEHSDAVLPDGTKYSFRTHVTKEHTVKGGIRRPLKRQGE